MSPRRSRGNAARLAGLGATILLHAAVLAVFLLRPAAHHPTVRAAALPIELLPLQPVEQPTPKPVEAAPQLDVTPPRPKPVHPITPVPHWTEAPLPTVPEPVPESAATIAAVPSPPPPPPPEPGSVSSDYVGLLARRLAQVKSYPVSARLARQQGTALLFFRLDREGHVLAWHIAQSSGYDALDAETAAMIDKAAPFPPFPDTMKQTAESFLVPIEFSLR